MKTPAWILSLALNVAVGVSAVTAGVQPAVAKEPRFPRLTLDQLSGQQKPFAEAVAKLPPGDPNAVLNGPFNALLRSPVLGQRMVELGVGYLNAQTTVPVRLNEFAMLIATAPWRTRYVWLIHEPKAMRNGLSPDIIAALKNDRRPPKMAEDEAVVYDFVTELINRKKISDPTFARAKKIFSDQQIVDLTVCVGNYTMVAMLLAMSEDTVPPGKEDPFKASAK